jgi:8-oxo-dGTP pyrophosphatase MutT (NUDIX family)
MSGEELTESERIERRELRRGHIGPGEEPAEPRPAATLVLGRGEGRDLELLLLRRPEEARFGAGAWVFPGGVVDPGDREAELAARLGPEATGSEPAFLAAAIRECFEETGLLPADRLPPWEERKEAREELLAGRIDLPGILERWELSFRELRAAYFARWITPARLSRRYDARFFLAEHRGGEPHLVHGEHTDAAWIAPATALDRFRTGELPMLFPTRKTVESLDQFGSLDEALEAYRRRTVEPVRPRLLVDEDRVVPVMPGDPEYERAGPEGS